MSPVFLFDYFLPVMAFAIGSCIGSFLNVVIYRLPIGLSVNEPRRSFCPVCKTRIPFWLNIPLVSWLMLRGKCKWCGTRIAFRYFLVELLTGICFLSLFVQFVAPCGLPGVIALWVLAALLIPATFIDFDHFIIPDSITLGGTVAGLAASFLVPVLHQETVWWKGGLAGGIGAAVGFSILWLIVLMGKMLFGKIHHQWEEPVDFEISQPGGEEAPILITLGEHSYEWGDVFFRRWDRLELDAKALRFDDEDVEVRDRFRVLCDCLEVDGRRVGIDTVKRVSGKITSAVVPREAMGFGDVKFMAMIGAFLGWQAAVFAIFAASVVGAVVGLMQKGVFREQWSRPLPFGPYLALGAFLWIFTGPAIWFWYIDLLRAAKGG